MLNPAFLLIIGIILFTVEPSQDNSLIILIIYSFAVN